jgi:hypothetical protein
VRLIVDLGLAGSQRGFVCPAVVSAEEQFSSTWKHDSHVGACAAPVAAVGCGQGRWCDCGSHVS